METLPDKYRAALQLHFIEEYTISQTAEILGENVSTVKQRLVRGKKLLASRLEKMLMYGKVSQENYVELTAASAIPNKEIKSPQILRY